jgi:transposase
VVTRVWSEYITRASRKLTRTILTWPLIQVADASLYFRNYHDEMKSYRGAGRSRGAPIRKLCGIMRRMLLDGSPFRYEEVTSYKRKRKQYERTLNQIREDRERKSA